MDKLETLSKIKDCGLVAVVRAKDENEAERITEACIEGGVAAIELTFTVPKAHRLIEHMADRYTGSGDIIIGAGTVLDSETARIAIPILVYLMRSTKTTMSTIVKIGVITVTRFVAAPKTLIVSEIYGIFGYVCGSPPVI